MTLDTDRFLEDLSGRHARLYTANLQDMLVAIATKNRIALAAARSSLEGVIRETMGTAEVLGASLTLRRAAAFIREDGHAFRRDAHSLMVFADSPTQTVLPHVTFEEAVQDLIDRTPSTIRRAAERTAQRISRLYSEGRVVAFVHSAEQAVTERVQSLITEAIREGIPEARVGNLIRMGVDRIRIQTEAWTEGYAKMAFRTNFNTAVTAGRFRQVRDQDIKAVIPAFRFDAVGDDDTRDNHDAADGLIFRIDNPIWNRLAPPLGYNCRCQVSNMSMPMLRRMGRITPNGDIHEDRPPHLARPDEGFRHGGRPDLFILGVA